MTDGSPQVLVVDDVLLHLELACELVKAAGCTPVPASSAEEALITLSGMPRPLAVLLDLYLPGQQGDACCRLIKANPQLADVPVVMMTAAESIDDVKRGLLAGADDYLPKPLVGKQVAAKLISIRARPTESRKEGSTALKTVLVADDDAFFRSLTCQALQRAGFRTITASTGLEVLQVLHRGRPPPDLVMLDLVMPGIGGLELLRKLRETPAWTQLPVVVVSAAELTPGLLRELEGLRVPRATRKEALGTSSLVTQVNAALYPERALNDSRSRFHRVCTFRRADDDGWQSGFIFELLDSGLVVRTLTPAEPNAELYLRFRVNEGSLPVTARGQVMPGGLTQGGMEVKLLELSEEAKAQLDLLRGEAAERR
jgi:CheY-like chemotaxis protein